jgi:hypothetical protein
MRYEHQVWRVAGLGDEWARVKTIDGEDLAGDGEEFYAALDGAGRDGWALVALANEATVAVLRRPLGEGRP